MRPSAPTLDFPLGRLLRVVHIVSGDRWAGAEVQAFTLLSQLQSQTELHVLLMNPGELAERCRSRGIATTVLDENRMTSWQLFKAIKNSLRRFDPDVIHTHRQKENIFGSAANLMTHRAKCLRTAHGAPEFTPAGRQRVQVWLDRFCGRHLQDAIIAVSADLRHKLLSVFPERKLHVISNGIDPEEIKIQVATPDFRKDTPNAVHIGLVGRLDPVKRVDLFLQMAAILLKRFDTTPWMFHVFGEGHQEVAMKEMAEDLGLGERVTFHGHRSDIRGCISGLDAVVMPSDHEGLPMAALETIALGVPLVAHATGGLVGLLEGESNFLVTEHQAQSYAASLFNVINQGIKPRPLAEEYLASHNSYQVLSLYRELLAPRPEQECQQQ